MIKESEYFFKVIETELNKLLVKTKKDYEAFNFNFWICKKVYNWGKLKEDHDQITEKYQQSTHKS